MHDKIFDLYKTHVFWVVCALVCLQERMPQKDTCLKEILLNAQNMLTNFRFNNQHNGGGATWSFNVHASLYSNNEQYIHMRFKNKF